MTEADTLYLQKYEQQLQKELLHYCHERGVLGTQLLNSPDIDDRWITIVQDYSADAIPEIAQYPLVALGWSMYIGMAIAKFWDSDWEHYGKLPQLYQLIRGKRGFDYIDEVVRQEILGYKGKEFNDIERLVQLCSQLTQSKIKHENIEPSTPLAYYVFLSSIHVLYQIGAAVILHASGYSFTKVE